MSRHLAVVAFALAIALGLTLASPPARAQADVPTHVVGDGVGFGASINLGELAAPFLQQAHAYDAMDDNITINELSLTGSTDIWVAMEVTGVTGTVYTIQQTSAFGVRLTFVADVSSTQFPQPGTYPGDDSSGPCFPPLTFPEEERSASVNLDLAYLVTAAGPSEWNVSDFALRETTTTYSVETRSTISTRGVPVFDFDETACELTITYEDRDLVYTMDVDAEIRTVYMPAYDFFDFPIADNETWWANSSSTVGGTVSGTIDLQGLDPAEEQEYFDMLNEALSGSGITVTGLTGFPIRLEDITISIGTVDYLDNGEIHDISVPVNSQLRARETQKTLADGQFHTVYLISDATLSAYGLPGCSWVYSPDHGFIVGYVCEIVEGVPIFELEHTEQDEAEQKVDETKTAYAVSVVPTNPFVDFFLMPPFLGLILVAAAVIVVAALAMRRRRKPAMAPPGMAPPVGPPPESPPPGP